jgi:Asp-tRNA(Asn)/Glu-tRNA(Gln) amidotransferase A subunit family amidase
MTYSLLLTETLQAFAAGVVTSRRCTEDLLERVREWEPSVQAWAALEEPRILEAADACDRLMVDETRPLRGLPFGVKDIIDTAELATQMGSPAFAGHQPPRDAEVVERLKRAGGFVMGKTHTTEFAFMTPAPTRNPWNLDHTPGGSSAGSAAAVAAGFVPAAIGTQTNGSVIRPAAFCGVVGFKPSAGLLPMGGVLPFSETLDQMGTFARSVADVAYITAPLVEGQALSAEVTRLVRGPRVGVIHQYPWSAARVETLEHLARTLERLSAAGLEVREVRLPPALESASQTLRTIMLHEAARVHGPRQERYRRLLSPALNEALDEGRRIDASAHGAALAHRAAAIDRAAALFDGVDVIVSPPAPYSAPLGLHATGDPGFCTLWSLVGFPAITVPSGFSAERLPFGLQLAAPAGHDDRLLAVAGWCEGVIGFEGSP